MKRVLALVTVSVVLAGAASVSALARSEAKQPIVIGMPIGLSGFVNFFDGPQLAGAQLAVTQINANGGLLGRPLKIVTADTKSDIGQSTNAALEVVSKGAIFIIPTIDYDFGGPAARVAQSKGIIAMTGAGDARWGVKGIGGYVYNTYPVGVEGAQAATFALRTKKWSSAYILADTSVNYSKNFNSTFKYSWAKIGGKIAGEDTFQNSDPSIATQISRIKQSNADFVFLPTYAPGGVSAIKQIRAAGINLPILSGVAWDGTFFLPGLPDEENFFVVGGGITTPGRDPNPLRRAFFRAYYLANGRKPAPLATQSLTGYTAVTAWARAVERAKSLKSAKVKAELDKFRNEPLVVGRITWTAKCHIPVPYSLPIKSFSNGREVFQGEPKPEAVAKTIC